MKNSRVTSIRALPPPTVNRVPEAQPPPSCMPMPKMKAPTITEVPTGETKPLTGWPNRLPAASAGKNSSTATASITICARSPAPRRSRMNTEGGVVEGQAQGAADDEEDGLARADRVEQEQPAEHQQGEGDQGGGELALGHGGKGDTHGYSWARG